MKTQLSKGVFSIPRTAAAELIRDAFTSRRYWMLVIDAAGRPLVEKIIAKYFPEDAPDEVRCIIAPKGFRVFACIALSKHRLSTRQLQGELRAFGIFLTRAETAEKDVFIATDTAAIDAASLLADELMSDPAAPKVRPEPPRNQWYGCPN